MGMVPFLPQELVDEAIDYLWDDFRALSSCSLTCRAWLAPARTHLFRAYRLSDDTHCYRLERFLEKHPHLIHYIRTLSVYPSSANKEDLLWLKRIPAFLSQLIRIREVGLARVQWCHVASDAERTQLILMSFGHLRRLTFSDVAFESSGEVRRVLAAAPNLTSLHMYHVTWNAHCALDPISPPRCYQYLKQLLLHSVSSLDTVVDGLILPDHTLELRAILIDLGGKDAECTGRLIRACERTLEDLHLDVGANARITNWSSNCMDLASASRLRVLHLDSLVLPACGEWLSGVLLRITSTRLKAVRLSILVCYIDGLSSLDWKCIDQHLSQPRFNGLKLTIYLSLAMGFTPNKTVPSEFIFSSLPTLQKNGTVSVVCL
ncbi:hypothetical protein OBBRIDRAFT_751999 [Obba rivulosa]|uniref:F-box domain-containing protein n=1 Tax=Obba rivulosa TaxID=1052685 RepID=A0A8E2DN56_9APHY|nr:hypothetical protein OBBRIDRAFT_751999 [Obba rivulosa]